MIVVCIHLSLSLKLYLTLDQNLEPHGRIKNQLVYIATLWKDEEMECLRTQKNGVV